MVCFKEKKNKTNESCYCFMFSLIIYILFSSINNKITKQKIQDNCLYQVQVYSY